MSDLAVPGGPDLLVVSDAAGRMRVHVPWIRSSALRAVAVEESVDTTDGVRAVHAYPRTGSVVVWYSPRRCDRHTITKAIASAQQIPADLVPARRHARPTSPTPTCCEWRSAQSR